MRLLRRAYHYHDRETLTIYADLFPKDLHLNRLKLCCFINLCQKITSYKRDKYFRNNFGIKNKIQALMSHGWLRKKVKRKFIRAEIHQAQL